jgi:nicotinate-nucleotide--dimethylbenzimidazole phosphoribosyltransferase
VTDAIDRLAGRPPLDVLAGAGGAEHAALVGVILAGAAAGVPVVLDGVIAQAAALVAVALVPAASDALVAAHTSTEPGCGVALERLRLAPVLDLGLGLGEGSGALLALPVVAAAARTLHDVAPLQPPS